MNKYQSELQGLRPDDEIQDIEYNERDLGYGFIHTAGHGYLVIPRNDYAIQAAIGLCEYGYLGNHAIYLEEDCEAPAFIKLVENNPGT